MNEQFILLFFVVEIGVAEDGHYEKYFPIQSIIMVIRRFFEIF